MCIEMMKLAVADKNANAKSENIGYILISNRRTLNKLLKSIIIK
jgi:hypothetical protein